MLGYLGSKRKLLPKIGLILDQFENIKTVADVFSGSARVGHFLKGKGYKVVSNDLEAFSVVTTRGLVQADLEDVEDLKPLLEELNSLEGKDGWFVQRYAEESRFFSVENAKKIVAIREKIFELKLSVEQESVLLASLLDQVSKHANTTGLFMGYHRILAPRALVHVNLIWPPILPRAINGKAEVYQGDALANAKKIKSDLAYLDPPYNALNYSNSYNVFTTVLLWDDPKVYGVGRIRVDSKKVDSIFNKKRKFAFAMDRLLQRLPTDQFMISFNDEGFLSKKEFFELLSKRGYVVSFAFKHPRFNVHINKGKDVSEWIFAITNDEATYKRLRALKKEIVS